MRRISYSHHDTTIQGIPCSVEVEYSPAIKGMREKGTGLPLEPDEPESYEIIQVFDRKGYKAKWLEDKITDEDVERINEELKYG